MRRIVVVSIIGIDRFTGGYTGGYGGYFAAKVAHERAMASGAIPVRILRAAQFHEIIPQFVDWGTRGEVSHAIADALGHAADGWNTAFDALHLTLFRSHLGAGPPRYEPVVEAALGG